MQQKKFLSKAKARWKSLAGIILLFAVMFTIIEVSPLTEASAADPEYGKMTISKDFVLKWKTDTTGNPDPGEHFRTIYWTFTLYADFDDGTSKKVIENVPISVICTNQNGAGVTTMVYRWDLEDTSATGYKKYAKPFKEAIESADGDVTIVANPTVEFYYKSSSGTETSHGTVTTKTAADDWAIKYFGDNGKSYFDNYFNKEVEIEAVKLKVKKDADDDGINLKTVTVDNNAVELKKSNVTKPVWYGKDDEETPKIKVEINDGYVFKTATSTKGVGVASKDTNTKGTKAIVETKTLTKSTTIKLVSEPVQVKIVYYLDEDGDGEYETKAGYYTYTYDSIDKDTAQLGYGIKSSIEMNGYTEWNTKEDGSGDSYEINYSKKFNDFIWTLYGTRDGEVKHTVYLYASKESDDPTDGDYKIVYDGNGATSGSMTDQYATYGTTTMLKTNAYLKTGYHTDKDDTWVSENNSVYYAEAQSVSDSTLDFDDDDKTVVTLDANWKPNECTIVYNGNGATSGTVKKQTITYDDWTTELRENKFSKTGTSFDTKLSWNTEPDGSGTTLHRGR